MKMGMITFLLLTMMANGYAKTSIPKFVIGDISGDEEGLDCGHYLKPEDSVPFEKKAAGLEKFIGKKDEVCTLNIANFMKHLDSQKTQVKLYEIFTKDNVKNNFPVKQLVVKTIGKMDFSDIQQSYPLLVESMLKIFEEDIKPDGNLIDVDSSIYNDKIEAFFKLRQEVAQTVALLAESYPGFMDNYVSEIESGLKHPVYLNSNGVSVIDLSKYHRIIEMYLNSALEKVRK